MTKVSRITLVILCVLCAASAFAANPPKVVFIGDYLTANWTYPTNPNWTNLGVATPDSYSNDGNSGEWASNFQTVLNLHPDIVHILVGAEDAALEDDGSIQIIDSIFAQDIQQMVQAAKANNIKVILGTTPASSPGGVGVTEMNGFIQQYGAANGITVVNYADALCGCIGSTGGYGIGEVYPAVTQGPQYHPLPLMTTTTNLLPGGYPALPIPTADGYALMTQMVENAIATTTGATLKSGYLENIDFGMGIGVNATRPSFDQNSVVPGMSLQFTPWGTYSDGGTRPLLNSNFAGSSGIWTSNNPSVMYVTANGHAFALSPGTAWISYVSPEGVSFSPWVMTVTSAIP
jgi:hypothetical protein